MTVHDSVLKGVRAGVQNMMESMTDDVDKYLDEPHDGFKPITWTGELASTIFLEKNGDDEYVLRATAPYSEQVEQGRSEPKFEPFFKDGALTSLGRWAIEKMGFTTDLTSTTHLLAPNGNRSGGLKVGLPHPFMEAESDVFKKYAEGDEGVQLIREHIVKELVAAGYAVQA